jgi:hypothetical protein
MLLSRKIDNLEKQRDAALEQGGELSIEQNPKKDDVQQREQTFQQSQASANVETVQPVPKSKLDITPDLPVKLSPSNTQTTQASVKHQEDRETNSRAKKQAKPAELDIFFAHIMSIIFEWFSPLTKIYESYKARGMLGIFFLTIAGAGLVLAGFGYLMQLLIDEMGAGSKSLLMSATAVSVIGGGIALKVKTKFSEFASAIVALGLLLCFSTIYFVGSVYQLIPGLPVLLLYAATALACHYLALWLDTKVIAVLGIVGITVMPLLTGSTLIDPTYFVIALLFVNISSLYLAYKHIGHWLADLTFAFTFIALGWIDAANAVFMSAWLINAFYLLFFAYIALNLFLHKTPTKRFLILLAALLGGTLMLLLQGLDYANFSGELNTASIATSINIQLLINATVGCFVAFLFFRVKHEHIAVMVLVAASWIVLSIVALLEATYWGIAWALEALLLIYMSRHYNLPRLVHQGQGLAIVALAYCLFAVLPYFPLPALQNQDGWVMVVMIMLLVSVWQRIIKSGNKQTVIYSDYVQTFVYPLLVIIETTFLSIIMLSCAYIWLGEWAGLTAILVQTGILFRAKLVQSTQNNKTILEVFACALIVFPLAYAVMGSVDANTLRFSMLPMYAKASLIMAFMQLWLWSAFYRKFNPQSSLRKVAEVTRIVFYLLLPVVWLPTSYRRLDEDVLLVLWLSPAIAILLAYFTKAKALQIESKILFVALTIVTLLFLVIHNSLASIAGLGGYIAIVALSFFLNKKQGEDSNYSFISSWALNTFGFMLAIVLAEEFNSALVALLIVTAYSIAVLYASQGFALCKKNKKFHLVYLAIITVASWLILINENSILFALPPAAILLSAYILKKRGLLSLFAKQKEGSHFIELSMHSYLLITYVLSCIALSNYSLALAIAPLLAVHGATILFTEQRTKTTVRFSFALILLGIGKLALVDTANVVLWQKVMLFIGIGVFILFASFWYQKLVSKDAELADAALTNTK